MGAVLSQTPALLCLPNRLLQLQREAPPRGGRVAPRRAPPLSLRLAKTHRAGQILFPRGPAEAQVMCELPTTVPQMPERWWEEKRVSSNLAL